MRTAVLVDDDAELELIKRTLRAIGHDCHVFADGDALLRELQRDSFDLLILEWYLPETSRPEIVCRIRDKLQERVPILLVTHRRQDQDVVEGLAAGADDFMVKPIHAGELSARVQILLRRAHADSQSDEQIWGRYRFLVTRRRLEVDGKPVVLTQKEFDLALTLFRNMGRVLSRQYLLDTVWGVDDALGAYLMSRSLDTHISRVRTALRLRPQHGYKLAASYGQGYRLEGITDESDLA